MDRGIVVTGATRFVGTAVTKTLANAIETLIKDSELRKSFGLAGRRLAEREFDVNSVVEKHLAIYDGLLRENGANQ